MAVNRHSGHINQPTHARFQSGGRGSGPPGKSQVIWVSIGNKQLDPPPLEKVGPPPPWKTLDPLGPLKRIDFFEIKPLDPL